jgi:type I restriction enzyme S subunit
MNDGWREVRLSELLLPTSEKKVPNPGEYPLLKVRLYAGGVAPSGRFPTGSRGGRPHFIRQPGQLLVGRQNIHHGSAGLVPRLEAPHVTSNAISAFDVRPEVVVPEFVLWLIQSETFGRNIESRMGGTGQKEISEGGFLEECVFLPPLAVQRRIVDLVTHLDNHLANLRTERDAAELVVNRSRADFLAPDASWTGVTLADLAEVRLGRMLSKERAAGEDLAPYIRNANVQWSGLDLIDLKQMSFPAKERLVYALKAGDILVCEGGDPGRAVLLAQDLDEVFYQKAIHRVRANSRVSSGYLYQWIRACYDDGRIGDLCTNTTIMHLTAEKFRTLRVEFPPPAKQDEIVFVLAAQHENLASLGREIDSLKVARNALLQELLTADTNIPITYDSLLPGVA